MIIMIEWYNVYSFSSKILLNLIIICYTIIIKIIIFIIVIIIINIIK